MNWCNFIVGFLHTSLSNKMYNKGCRLHLMLMYVDKLDISTVNLNPFGGLPPSHKFAAWAWTDAAIKVVLSADRKPDGTFGKLHLMGEQNVDYNLFGGPANFNKWMDGHTNDSCPSTFASGMTNILGNVVRGWTAMSAGDGDEVANQFRSFVCGGTSHPTGSRGRYDHNDSQEIPPSDEDLSIDDSDYDDDDQQDDTCNDGNNRMDDTEHDTLHEDSHGGAETSTGQG
ncbi:uncharacterized protein [Triticum aestivum]|uniref:uncharacterized protein isoform X2 n=1 Tax=Triticum aestivum TaxID=4565 RepID=UPI001D0307C4|nr:uncharacterized protein LOC123161168 isoform X2 [Triticum aestivum]